MHMYRYHIASSVLDSCGLILNGEKENMSDISNKKAGWAFEHSDPFKYSPGSHSQLVSCFVGIMSSCSLLVFLLLVSLASSCLRCLCSLISQTCNCAWLVVIPVLKAAIRSTKVKSHRNNLCDVIIAHVISADVQTNKQTNRHRKHKTILRPARHVLHTRLAGKHMQSKQWPASQQEIQIAHNSSTKVNFSR